jgi:hypothetical protein
MPTVRETVLSLPEALVEAAGSLVDTALDRVLLSERRVTSAAEGKRILAGDDDLEGLTDQVQKFVGFATPALRALGPAARFTRVPWALVASSAVSITVSTRVGVREVQVLGSLIAHRLEMSTGERPDPALVKKLTIELYLDPRSTPDVADPRLRVSRLARRWLMSGALARDTRRRAYRSLDAAEQLDGRGLVTRWRTRAGAPVCDEVESG